MTEQNNIYLVCGSGGVGKTTTSAALGLRFASQGKKVIVLTIDPARRLATALGIAELSDVPVRIDLKKSKSGTGELWAMMLDTKRTFDRLVDKYASSKDARDRIFHNSIYKHLSKMLAGTQEYMAMERLYEISQDNAYDMIIIDTPPMQNAMEFLQAPLKMMNVINNSMLHLLIKPTLSLGKSGLKLIEKGSQQVLKIFDRITGFAFMQDLSEMLVAFKDLLTGFELRASEVDKLLQQESTAFVLVTTTSDHAIEELESFAGQLQERRYHLQHVVVNRVYEGQGFSAKQFKRAKEELEKKLAKDVAEALVDNYKMFLPLIRKDKKQIKKMIQLVSQQNVTIIPQFMSDVHDIKGLQQMAEKLITL